MINEATLFPKRVSNLWGKQLRRRKLGLTGSDSCIWAGGGVRVLSLQPARAFEDLETDPFPPPIHWAPQPSNIAPSPEIKWLATLTCRGDHDLFPVVLEID